MAPSKQKTSLASSNPRVKKISKGKSSVSKATSCVSKGKVSTPSSSEKEQVVINYYDIKFVDDEHKKKYERLFVRGVTTTRYCDIDVINSLHIEDDTNWLFSNVGWGNFLMNKYPTYKRVTLEFLSSLKAVTYADSRCGDGMITFQMYNETHTWTVTKFNEVLGLPTTGPRLTPKHWSAVPLWRILTGENDYDSKESSITSVRHPALPLKYSRVPSLAEKNGVRFARQNYICSIICFMLNPSMQVLF